MIVYGVLVLDIIKMLSIKCSVLVFALVWFAGQTSSQNIFMRPLQKAGHALNDLTNASLDAVKTAFDAVESGLDAAIETRNIIVDRLSEAIENFRKTMGAGIEELGIPRLDPLEIDHVEFDINHEIGRFNGSLHNVKIEDLSLFKVNKIDGNAILLTAGFDLTFPTVKVTGIYDINGTVADMFKLFGAGPFDLIVYNLTTIINARLGFTKGEFYIKTIALNIKLERVTCNFQNLMGGGETGKVFNEMIGSIAPEAVRILWPEIGPIINARIKDVADDIVKKIDLSTIFGPPHKKNY